MDSPARDYPIEERLREVYDKTDSREYAEALDTLEATRLTDPGNIYISALKRQLEALLSLSQADDLSEERRRELMDPMQGIIECAVRDNQKQHTGATEVRLQETPSEGAGVQNPAESGDAQKELEALKLLYFQRASKFVMKGEYEQALAEVRRVFVVDPENMIAREYASRVEQLIQHARALAAEPAPETGESPAMQATPPAEAEVPPAAPARAERPTAWDDDFVAPRQATTLPEHRPAPSSARQTVAYGDRLAVSLSEPREENAHDERAPRKKSRLFLLLATVILTPLIAGVGIAVFSAKNGPTVAGRASAQVPVQNVSSTTSAEATIGTPAPVVQALPAHAADEHAAPAVSALPKTTALPEQKPKNDQKPAAEEPAPRPAAVQAAPPQIAAAAPQTKTLASEAPAPAAGAPSAPSQPPAQQQAPSPAFVAVEKEPQIVRLEKPEFPSFVWRMGGEGQVVIRVLIDANGKPLDSQILKSTSPVFEQPVVDAVMKSQFNPAQMGQGPVAAWLTIPFRFKQPK